LVILVLQVAHKDHKVLQELMEHKDHKVRAVFKVRKVLLEILEHKDHKVPRAVHKVHKEK
jgi:hypothetical protein